MTKRRKNSNNSDLPSIPIEFVAFGILSSILVLYLTSTIPFTQLSVAGFLPASQLRANVSGLHFKHWMTGTILVLMGLALLKSPRYTKLSAYTIGFGMMLVADELDDIYYYTQTGTI